MRGVIPVGTASAVRQELFKRNLTAIDVLAAPPSQKFYNGISNGETEEENTFERFPFSSTRYL